MIDYVDSVWILFKREGSVVPAAALHAIPSTVFALFLVYGECWAPVIGAHLDFSNGVSASGSIWTAMTTALGIVLALRIKQGLGRFWEGTSLLHQARGEWFDAASCLITFSRDAKLHKGMAAEVNEFRNTLVRLMSLMHGSALDEISCDEASFEVIDIHGVDTETLRFLSPCQERCNFSKVEALQHLIQVLITDNHHRGVLSIPAPILSRVYQTLSRGFVHLLNARKIKDTMFPLPLAQLIRILLLVHCLFTPLAMKDLMPDSFLAVFLTFMPVFGLYALNITAMQLEMPFGVDANDLPLHQFHNEMNDTLLMLIEPGSDHLPTSSDLAVAYLARAPRSGRSRYSLPADDEQMPCTFKETNSAVSTTTGGIQGVISLQRSWGSASRMDDTKPQEATLRSPPSTIAEVHGTNHMIGSSTTSDIRGTISLQRSYASRNLDTKPREATIRSPPSAIPEIHESHHINGSCTISNIRGSISLQGSCSSVDSRMDDTKPQEVSIFSPPSTIPETHETQCIHGSLKVSGPPSTIPETHETQHINESFKVSAWRRFKEHMPTLQRQERLVKHTRTVDASTFCNVGTMPTCLEVEANDPSQLSNYNQVSLEIAQSQGNHELSFGPVCTTWVQSGVHLNVFDVRGTKST